MVEVSLTRLKFLLCNPNHEFQHNLINQGVRKSSLIACRPYVAVYLFWFDDSLII
jgi:hypothetical protein